MTISRREFLKVGGAGISVSLLFSDLLKGDLIANPSARKILVIVQLAGGNDSLNTFIPYTDRRYNQARPTLALHDEAVLKVDDRFAFHSSMQPLKELYDQGRLAFVNGVGFPSLDRSHFRCRNVWQTADESAGPAAKGQLGWLGRYADAYLSSGATAVTTFAVGGREPLGLTSRTVSGTSIISPEVFSTSTDLVIDPRDPSDIEPYKAALFEIYGQQKQPGDVDLIRTRGRAAFEAVDLFKQLGPASMASYPNSRLGRTLQLIARIAAADIGTAIVWIAVDGFDTHGLQATTHSKLLGDVSSSLLAFQQDLNARRLADNVVVLAWSEFGRRVFENGNLGTDHGKAGTVFLIGNRVKGGAYGDVPDLSDLDDGDLKTRIDFRSVYWTVIEDWLSHDPLPVLQRRFENLGFMQRAGRVRAIRH